MQKPRQDIMRQALKSYNKGDFADAERLFEKTLRQTPGDFNALHMLGLIRARQRRFAEADRLIAKALDYGASAEAFSNHGNVLSELGRHEEAIRQLRRALLMKPDYAEAQFNLGNALVKCNRMDEAAKAFAAAIRIKPDFADALENLIGPLRELGRYQEADAALRRVLEFRPRDANLHNQMGIILQEAGQLDDAIAAFDRALELDPLLADALYHRARITKVGPGDDIVPRMEALARNSAKLPLEARSMLSFALAKAHEDIGRYDEAFAELLEGNRLARPLVDYDEADFSRRFLRLRTAFTAELMAEKAGLGSPSEVPIFIVGFPRSGTTLTEQILASHPLVHGSGEHSYIGELASAPALDIGEGVKFPESLSRLPADVFRRLGDAYAERLRRISPSAQHITDKLPGNFMFLGFIRLILPKAKIIHVMRDPVDTCVSCFALRFRLNNIGYAYDLGELGRYYRMYLDLMDHWRRVLPPESMLEVRYEKVIEDVEAEARRIVAYCGLPWDDSCLAFHETERAVRTASVNQVRQPIYRTSMQRWRRFEKHLGPLFAALGETPLPPQEK